MRKNPERPLGSGAGRPRRGAQAQRRTELLDHAERLLIDGGAGAVTVDAVVAAAGCSKTTVYSWFGGRSGLVVALVERQASAVQAGLEWALSRPAPPRQVLNRFAEDLLALLTGPVSIALNRAAATDAAVAAAVLAGGRHTVGPLLESYLATQHSEGLLHCPDPADAFRTLYGLVVADTQIRVLLGEPTPSATRRRRLARTAVDRFLALSDPAGPVPSSTD